MFCSECGQQNADDAKFCMKCGKKLDTVETVPLPDKDPSKPTYPSSQDSIKESSVNASTELKDSGTVTAMSVIGLVFGLIGMLGSFIPCIGALAFYVGIPAAIISAIGLGIAYSQNAKRTFAIVALTISLIGVVISGWQYFSIRGAGNEAKREIEQWGKQSTSPSAQHALIPSQEREKAGSFEAVKLLDVLNSDDLVKIILKHDDIDPEYRKGFMVTRFDIDNDGKKDILYTYLGASGSCGYTWNILINKGGNNFEKSKHIINCTGEKLDFSNQISKGMRVPYFMGKELKYDN